MDSFSESPEGVPGYFLMERSLVQKDKLYACERYAALKEWFAGVSIERDSENESIESFRKRLLEILWYHQDILLSHLVNINAIWIMDRKTWLRSQEWDNVYSFYDPEDKTIRICQDVVDDERRFEQAFLVALGQALLGNYASFKEMVAVEEGGEPAGKIYKLKIKVLEERNTFLSDQELAQYLKLSRMIRSESNKYLYTRLVNGNDGFTPPGLLFGLLYAWYLDNRFAAHVEYKMAVMRTDISDLIPEQVRVLSRRRALVEFFQLAVFCNSSLIFE